MNNQSEDISGISWTMVVRFLVYVVLLPFVLFIAAGRFDWTMAWIYIGIHILFTLVSRLIVFRTNPEMLVERARSTQKEDVAGGDRLMVLIVGLIGPLVLWIIAGLDHRYSWSPDISFFIEILALACVIFGYAVGTWAMITNAFFSAVVRIQEDRDHRVVTDGPYRIVRHPAYAGGLFSSLGIPLMLGSVWALIPAGLALVFMVMRTVNEDKMLMEELPGYSDFAQQTRYRLIPGIW
ncbi:MAG: isoprenylcysteine carboxylmethyltransferase family protein [Anaerolineales bacterium]|nr:isoprenylcysteine carboxylmethyltransferase family protein [Anaerolineales bacterium]